MEPDVIKLFTDKSLLLPDDQHIYLLYPFWGLWPEPPEDRDNGRFDEYTQHGGKFFELVSSLEEADAALLPFGWQADSQYHIGKAQYLSNEAKKQNKKIVVFFNSDSSEPLPIDNAIIIRTSFYNSLRGNNEFSLPGWSVDFLHKYNNDIVTVREKSAIPSVGYCGYIDYELWDIPGLLLRLKEHLGLIEMGIGAHLRGQAIRTLQRDRRIQLNFIRRSVTENTNDLPTRQEYARV